MKKFILLISLFIIIPMNAYALKLSTVITGIDTVSKGDSIIYTVIVDRPLNNYKAEITYDRDVLNLVDVKEVNINTTTKNFNVEKSDTIVIDINSENLSNIIYTVEFKVKSYIDISDTKFTVKTLSSKGEFEFTPDENEISLNIIEEEKDDTEIVTDNKKINALLDDIKKILSNYGNPILYGSLGLNLIFLIALISNIRRKKVDYDF